MGGQIPPRSSNVQGTEWKHAGGPAFRRPKRRLSMAQRNVGLSTRKGGEQHEEQATERRPNCTHHSERRPPEAKLCPNCGPISLGGGHSARSKTLLRAEGSYRCTTTFCCPTGDKTWPKLTWGWSLGCSVSTIRCMNTYAKQVAAFKEELEGMDFCFTDISESDWTEKILPALEVYRQVFDHCIVEQSFVVPAEFPWPEKAWGMRLGATTTMVRCDHQYAKQSTRDKALLDSLGFAWDTHGSVWRERIVPTVKTFAAQNGHCKVPARFVVPSQDPWSKHAWGIDIGNILCKVRRNGSNFSHFGRDADWLDALELNMRLSPKAFKKYVAPLLDTYATVTATNTIQTTL